MPQNYYRMTIEEIDDFLTEVNENWKDYSAARKDLVITLYDDRRISYHSPDEHQYIIGEDGISKYSESDRESNTIKFDKQNKFMNHSGRLIGTVQLYIYDDDDDCGYTFQLSNAYAEYWSVPYEDIWIDACRNGVIDMRFMAYEDKSDERIEIAYSICRRALMELRKKK